MFKIEMVPFIDDDDSFECLLTIASSLYLPIVILNTIKIFPYGLNSEIIFNYDRYKIHCFSYIEIIHDYYNPDHIDIYKYHSKFYINGMNVVSV